MEILLFSRRNGKEILRDPVNLLFGLAFPLVLLGLMTLIQKNIPADIFAIDRLAPGIAVFSQSFLTLFAATLVSRDRETAFLQRLYTTPLSAGDFLLGYALPMVPLALGQSLVCYAGAVALGLPLSGGLAAAVGLSVPVSFFNIALGLLCGSGLNVKQAGSICGALLTNLSAWLSGAWFDLELVGGVFRKIAYALPFAHAVELERGLIAGSTAGVWGHFAWVMGYAAILSALAAVVFLRQMKRQ